MSAQPFLRLDAVSIAVPVGGEPRRLVHDATLEIAKGEMLGLVGESGSGKSLTTRAIMGLLPTGSSIGGTVEIAGESTAAMSTERMRRLRARDLGMVFQTPRAHLNPLRTIGDFMTEALVTLDRMPQAKADEVAVRLLDEVGVAEPRQRLRQKPAALSGGLLQRVMIAATLATDPTLLLADEITTALDVTTQEEVMALLADLRRDRGLAVLFITHDLTLAATACDRICVMQAGRTIETLDAASMDRDATHEHTRLLLAATTGIGAPVEATRDRAAGPKSLLRVLDLRKTYRVRAARGFGSESATAVDDVSFALEAGGSLGIVGESGSGKSTTARIICGLETADAGSVEVAGRSWLTGTPSTAERRRRARVVQMVFQDPYQSLDRRQTVRQCLAEVLALHEPQLDRAGRDARVLELLGEVRLEERFADVKPRSLSGGQRQRVAIARALAARPQLLVLDEAVSALDATIRAEILRLLARIRAETGVALLFISHDLAVVRAVCDDVIVLRRGRIEEAGPIARVLDDPQAEYTRALLDSIPRPGWTPRRRRGAATLQKETP